MRDRSRADVSFRGAGAPRRSGGAGAAVATACALGLLGAGASGAQQRLLIQWTDSWKVDMMPGWSGQGSFRVGPLTVVLDEDGNGVSAPVVPELTASMELGPALKGPPANCRLGETSNSPVRVIVETWNASQVDLRFERLGDGSAPCYELICPPPLADASAPSCIPVGYAETQYIFDPRALQPGTPLLLYPASVDTPVVTSRDEISVALNPCEPQPGSAGDGTVLFRSSPPIGVTNWPVAESHDMTRAELSRRVTAITGRSGVRSGYTFATFPDSPPGDPRAGAPRISDTFQAVQSGAGVCHYLDRFDLQFPEIQVWLPSEYWEARAERCWYAAVRQHEARHAQLFEDSFRAVQRRLGELVADPTTATPARPRYFPSIAEAQQAEDAFRRKVMAIVREELAKLQANNAAMDEDEQYRYEEGLCRMPETL